MEGVARVRRQCPTAWDTLLGEVRAGHRRFVDTDHGDNYQTILAHLGEGEYEDPAIYERTLTDLITPTRPGTTTQVVNAVSSEISADAAAWRLQRLLSMVATIEQREPRPSDLG